jgi:hypothetical protein
MFYIDGSLSPKVAVEYLAIVSFFGGPGFDVRPQIFRLSSAMSDKYLDSVLKTEHETSLPHPLQFVIINYPPSIRPYITYAVLKGKVKVKLSPCLTKYHAMKTYRGSGGIIPRILDLGTRWR